MFSRYFLLIIFGFVLYFNLIAQAAQYALTEPVDKKIIFEQVYLFYVMQYSPTIKVEVLKTTPENSGSDFKPEIIAIAYLSSQAQGNYNWYYSLLSTELQQKLSAELVSSDKTSSDLVREWQNKFQNTTVELTYRIERGSYPIIRYRISKSDGTVIEEKDIAFGISDVSGLNWRIINLTGDPVFENWTFEGNEKRIVQY